MRLSRVPPAGVFRISKPAARAGLGVISMTADLAERDTSRLAWIREQIEEQYRDHPTGCGGSFEELLCHEIHSGGLTFIWLAEKWGISLPTLGELIYDHCKRLEGPQVNHDYKR